MFVELSGGVVLGVILAIVSQVVDTYTAKSRRYASQMNTVSGRCNSHQVLCMCHRQPTGNVACTANVVTGTPCKSTCSWCKLPSLSATIPSHFFCVCAQVREYMLNRGLPKTLQTKILYYYSNYLRCDEQRLLLARLGSHLEHPKQQ
jgi:hypothetical protein